MTELDRLSAKVRLRLASGLDLVKEVSDILRIDGAARENLIILCKNVEDARAHQALTALLKERGARDFTPREAVAALSRDVAAMILSGQLDWREGAEQVYRISLSVDERFPELETFIYAALEDPEDPSRQDAFRSGVLEAARDLVTTGSDSL
jgi:hypothetical protein